MMWWWIDRSMEDKKKRKLKSMYYACVDLDTVTEI